MANETITIPGGAHLHGTLPAISSKSDLHRLIFCACLADTPSRIRFASELSKDIAATAHCFEALGAKLVFSGNELTVEKPLDRGNIPSDAELFCNESGSTARFLLPLASLLCTRGAVLTGAGKLPERPFEDLCAALEAAGARFDSHHLPMRILQHANPHGYFEIRGNVSSQYITGLLFILPLCGAQGIRLTTALESAGYVALTADALRRYGVRVEHDGDIFRTVGSYRAPGGVIDAQGDWSNAAFWLCAADADATVTVTGLDLTSSQPDRRVCEILQSMGMKVDASDNRVTVSAPNGTHGMRFDARDIPDLVPILCVRAAVSQGETVITGISRLRIKESDRVQTVCELVTKLGGDIRADADSITVRGVRRLTGGTVDSFNDHRIAMSAAVAAVFSTAPVTIRGCRAVEKSYPLFYKHYEALSGLTLPAVQNEGALL